MHRPRLAAALLALALGLIAGPSAGQASPGTVLYDVQITEGRGGFTGALDVDDIFGYGVAGLGDLDGNGVGDVIVGAPGDDDGGSSKGALWVLFLESDMSVTSYRKISALSGGFSPTPGTTGLGTAVASLGDLDGDGVTDVAAGTPSSSVGPVSGTGTVWILFLQPDGSVRSQQQIGPATGGFSGTLKLQDRFGAAVTAIGDIDGDGVTDLAVGADNDDDGSFDSGALWILFLHTDGTVKGQQKISKTQGGFTGAVGSSDHFGCSLAAIDDLDGDGVPELASGSYFGSAGGLHTGVVWMLFLAANGTVKSQQVIGAPSVPGLLNGDIFGYAAGTIGDLDGDGRRELAVGAPRDGEPGGNYGCVYILFLDETGAVADVQQISQFEGGFGGTLPSSTYFGRSLADPGDLDGDGAGDILVGAPGEPSSTAVQGDAWLLFLARAPWTWLGSGLGGAAGVPQLVGTGSLLGGQPAVLDLTHAAPLASATLVVGLSVVNAPFKSGVLVPFPAALVPAVTDAAGALSFATTWPTGLPSGLTIYLQDWIIDATAPQGLAASNAVSATVP